MLKAKPKSNTKALVMIAIAVVILILSRVLPLPDGLSREGMTALGVMIAALVLWVSEAMNMAVTTILLVCMLPFFGVMKPAEMFKGFGGSVFFFMIGTMSITTALASTTIPNRMAGAILAWSKNNPGSWSWASPWAPRSCPPSCPTCPPAPCSPPWASPS